jgi:dipeptidyl aminopeptidase/acylaminoacyl peptidase
MNRHDLLAAGLRVHLRNIADERPAPGQLGTILSLTATIRPRPDWLATMRRATTGVWARASANPAVRLAVVVLLAILMVLAVALIAGQRERVGGLLGFSRNGTVYLARPDGSGAIQAAEVPEYVLGISPVERAWSPEGRYLAVDGFPLNARSGYEPPSTVFVLDSRTLALRAVGAGTFIGWTPDGLALVASGSTSLATFSIDERTIEATGHIETEVLISGASLSPDGHWLAVTPGPFLVLVDVQTGATKTLYDNGGELVDRPAWSPDSSRIAFARTRSPQCHMCVGDGPILVVTVDGSRVTPVSRPDWPAVRANWSPNGEWIAYKTREPETGIEQYIEIVHPDGSERRTLPTGSPHDMAWSPDGARILYMTEALDEAGSRFILVEIGLMDGQIRRLDDGAGVEAFAWQSLPAGSSIPPLQPEGQ